MLWCAANARRGPKGPRSLVEVGGIEPPSRKISTSASPSAASSELSERWDSAGKHPDALSAIVLPHRSRNPGGGIPHCIAWVRRGGCPPVRQERLSTLPVRNFRCLHLCLYRLFNEDSGDLGSLPTHQRSRSKPVHPHCWEMCCCTSTWRGYNDGGSSMRVLWCLPVAPSA